MPIYEYRCDACDGRFERLVARAEEEAPRCPQCGAPRVKRLLSVFAVTKPSSPPSPGPCGSSNCACRS